ncbi:hypothetical protein O6H91_06G091000 [Diphasiastrum complanatum]|uniref:Uncharacterized protein n=2 Tax=Diphasiastrum complanatum TaxID=34168 RepID=A0ACC2DG23_DIPCM|nr:hypothetical protein O6H91_Y223800 [Diphasiastrum complanatum]KAJ7553288.1 hypothetical protein O6H91_06G091000 [Diphasiastrum complanatum]KAJ7553289.1 hypothetical protein O6H91_06G091000 [Diphasiastrum complanatum]
MIHSECVSISSSSLKELKLRWNMASLVQKPAASSLNLSSRLASRLSISLPQRFVAKACVPVDDPGSEVLSGKERRKQRNERREELKVERRPVREVYEEKVLVKPSKKFARKDPLDMDRLEARGMQWWIVRVPKNGEKSSAENLSQALSAVFPELDFEVWAAAIPSKNMLANGSYSESRRGLHPGCIFLRCILNKELYDFIRGVERVTGFMGSKLTFRKRMVILPSSVGKLELDGMRAKVKAEEEEFALLKDEASRKKEEKRLAKKNKVKSSETVKVDAVTSGDTKLGLPSS